MNKIILGIDPGLATTGFGVVCEKQGEVEYLSCGYIATAKNADLAQRLLVISKSLDKLIKQYQPGLVAVESIFFAQNRTTAIVVAQARGVILATSAKHNLPLVEYTPLQVKQALTGYGRADKKQIQKIVKSVLKLKDIPKPDDSADALAIAICAAHSYKAVLK